MAITRYTLRNALSPWRELEEASSRLSRFFDDVPFGGPSEGAAWIPAVNVSESKDELVLTAELPGMKEDQISIEMENGVLSISGEKNEERTEGDEERRYHVWERRYGTFQRAFTLPRTVKADEIRAHYEHGVLEIHLPKVAEAKGRKISIEKAQK